MPPIIFGQPDPRENGPQRWWHIPIIIGQPANKLIAFFTELEIADVHAEVVIAEWRCDTFLMRWESDAIGGSETVTLDYHQTQRRPLVRAIPLAIRRTIEGAAFRGIDLDSGETYITNLNFVHHAVKNHDALLRNGTTYSLTLRLWSAQRRNWSASQRYSLIVPLEADSNDAFVVAPVAS